MIKRSLLAATLSALGAASAQATPFLPMDARGLAMGNTGVASAQRAHAPAYNPSLLSQAEHDDSFAILFPQVGVSVTSEDDLYDTFLDIHDDLVPELEDLLDDQAANNFTDNVDALDNATDAMLNAVKALENYDPTNPGSVVTDLKQSKEDFDTALETVSNSINDVNSVTNKLSSALNSVSGDSLSGRAGAGFAVAFPGKQIAAALTLDSSVTLSGRAVYSTEDDNLLRAYGTAAGELADKAQSTSDSLDPVIAKLEQGDDISAAQYTAILDDVEDLENFNSSPVDTAADGNIRIIENGVVSDAASDPELNSELEIIAIGVANLGLTLSREFTVGDNRKVAVGITPKLQRLIAYHYVTEADNDGDIDLDQIEDDSETFQHLNVDLGASFRLGSTNKWVVGVVGKNLVAKEIETKDVEIRGSNGLIAPGQTITLDPQWRAGVAFNGDITTLAFDVDLIENDPIAFEDPTQYAAIGAEVNLWNTLQLRLGYRTNMSVTDSEIASVGFGLSPWGVHIDIAGMANPNDVENEFGFALETGFYF